MKISRKTLEKKHRFIEEWISKVKSKNDNRNYEYGLNSRGWRDEYKVIIGWIPRESKVLDLGCGDGSLLLSLKEKGVEGEGVEISKSGVESAKRKGLKVHRGRIDQKLPYKKNHFDFAICNVTLQMVMYPEVLLLEMKRIAKKQIITFPNFAFVPNRLDLLVNGRMPRVMIPGYEWYSTGHIHQFSIKDFEFFCRHNGIKILKIKHVYPGSIFSIPEKYFRKFPNLFASTGVFLTTGVWVP